MLNTYQVSVGASAVKLIDVPPGPVTVVLTNTGTAAVAIGTTANVTATTGGLIPATNGVVTLANPTGTSAKGYTLYGIAAGGTNAVGIFLVTAS